MEKKNKFSIFRKTNTFAIFDNIVDDYNDKSILDFGGNRGNLISSAEGKILPKNYTSLDVSQEALDLCNEENPGVTTIHWNKYHRDYNPHGTNARFPKLRKYDIGFANSVFTHMKIDEALFCIEKLYKSCSDLYFTYIDPSNHDFLKKFNEKYYELQFDDFQVSYTEANGMFWSAFNTEHFIDRIKANCQNRFKLDISVGTTEFNFNWIKIKANVTPILLEINPAIGY